MRKYVILAVLVSVLAFSALASGIQFNILTYYTVNLQDQSTMTVNKPDVGTLSWADIWPIAYLNIPVTKQLTLNIQDYLATNLATFSAFGVTLIQPTFWYASYTSGNLNVLLGNFRSNHVLTREYSYLWIMPWVGGFYDHVTGAEVNYSTGPLSFGGRYVLPPYSGLASTFGGYLGYNNSNFSLYGYAAQDSKYSKNDIVHLSTNGQLNFNLGDVSMSAIGAAAYNLNTSSPSFGMPTTEIELNANYNNFSIQSLYANQPTSKSAYINFDATDPDTIYGYPLQVAQGIFTYNLDKSNAIGGLVDWNSNLSSPSFGLFYQHGYFSVTVGTGNMTGSIPGSNYIVLNYSTWTSMSLTSGPLF
jgi:hypothetical protein